MDCYQKSNVFCQSQSFHKRLLSHYNLRANFLKLEQFLIKTPFFIFVNFIYLKKNLRIVILIIKNLIKNKRFFFPFSSFVFIISDIQKIILDSYNISVLFFSIALAATYYYWKSCSYPRSLVILKPINHPLLLISLIYYFLS